MQQRLSCAFATSECLPIRRHRQVRFSLSPLPSVRARADEAKLDSNRRGARQCVHFLKPDEALCRETRSINPHNTNTTQALACAYLCADGQWNRRTSFPPRS